MKPTIKLHDKWQGTIGKPQQLQWQTISDKKTKTTAVNQPPSQTPLNQISLRMHIRTAKGRLIRHSAIGDPTSSGQSRPASDNPARASTEHSPHASVKYSTRAQTVSQPRAFANARFLSLRRTIRYWTRNLSVSWRKTRQPLGRKPE